MGLINKIKYDIYADRLGPDCPFTHWKLYFKNSMKKLCKKKFNSFADSAEFRAGAYAVVCSKISLGERVVIRPTTMLFAFPNNTTDGSIIIEDNVMLGSGVQIYTSNHRYDIKGKDSIDQGYSSPKSVFLRKGCWLGANVIVLNGVTIGENSVIGAGSIVTKSIPSNVVAVGSPAKIVKKII